jgi:hypothetical protein
MACQGADWAKLASQQEEDMHFMESVRAMSRAIQGQWPEATFKLLFANYMEHVAVTLVGADAVVAFFKFCY